MAAMRPTKPTTPEQQSVIVWAAILIFAGLGCVGLWYWSQAPADKVEEARQLLRYSLASLAIAATIYAGKVLTGYFFD